MTVHLWTHYIVLSIVYFHVKQIHWDFLGTYWLFLLRHFQANKSMQSMLYTEVKNGHSGTILEMYKSYPQQYILIFLLIVTRVNSHLSFQNELALAEKKWSDYASSLLLQRCPSSLSQHKWKKTPEGNSIPISHCRAGCAPKQCVPLEAAPSPAACLPLKHCLFPHGIF